jgi:adenylate kinase family enzyme
MAGVLIVGAAGAGKDTLAGWIQEDFGTRPIGFADPLRLFLRILLGPGKHREAAQAIGDVVRAGDPEAFVRLARRRAARARRYVITDARLPRELAAFPDALRIGIRASESVRAERLARRDGSRYQPLHHVTETWVETLLTQCDVVLTNDAEGLERFRAIYREQVQPLVVAFLAERRIKERSRGA